MTQPAGVTGPVGFVGLGVMGSAMSSHLIEAGHRVIGYDVAAAARDAHAARGGEVAESPAEVAASAGLVVTSLPSAAALAEVLDGLAAGAAEAAGSAGAAGAGAGTDGLIVLETSTLALADKTAGQRALAGCGGILLDCPMSGTGAQARRKDLVAYLSGAAAAKARARPVLAAMTRQVYDVGAFGNGMKLKIVANLLVTVHNLAAAEALVLAEQAGLDLATVLTAVGDGAGSSRMFEVRGPAMAARDYTQPGIRAQVYDKDIAIIAAFAAELRSPTPLFSLASAFYQAALAQGHGDDDTSSVHAVLRQLAPGGEPSAPSD
ncbi:MAG TPA: NAD(P)-dependent oxidoreductase [Streptosporangiaceae bacterium]|jgi:3-hydroxyisobutyrate dehydrogenase-like beta-hydroxyacid dehydrogenase